MRLSPFSLALSLALHALVVAIAFISLPRVVPTLELPEAVPIEIVQISEETNVSAISREKPGEPVEEPEPETARPAPEAAPEPPEPEPVPEETPPEEEKPEEKPPEPKPEEKPPEPKPDPPKQEEEFSLDSIGVLIDKAQKERGEKTESPEEKPAPEQGEKPREAQGEGTLMTMDLVASFRRQISRCYSPPAGADRAEELVVQIDITLRPDGSLAEPPQVVDETRMGEPYFRAAAEAGVRAIHQCAPYDLPADRYEQWKSLRLNFDPRKMLGL